MLLMPTSRPPRWLTLAAVCLAVFVINLDSTIVNVALPRLGTDLHANTAALQWIVDGYNLTFAGLVLAAGGFGDRFGRRPALIAGLLGFAVTSAVAALCASAGELIAARVAMGACAALIFPTTLSVIANTFPDRGDRAKAVGAWGAVSGVGVAVGPVTGGLLLAHFGWGSVFLALVPVALLAAALVLRTVPESRDPAAPPLDRWGLALSVAMVGLLVSTVIEAPSRGWESAASLAGWVGSAVLAVTFVLVERRARFPLLDVTLFADRRFSAASGAVTVAFFALFGFIFLITQYLQVIKGYGPLSAGVRTLPVAASIAAASVLGARLAPTVGTRRVVSLGLLLLAAAFLWTSTLGAGISYLTISAVMVLMGLGLGATSAPATESILTVLPPARAGVGSAVNDATRELGGTLGVAILGSVYASRYAAHLTAGHLPTGTLDVARSSVGAGLAVAHGGVGTAVIRGAFMSGLHTGCGVAGLVCLAGVAAAGTFLPGRTVPAPIGDAPVRTKRKRITSASIS